MKKLKAKLREIKFNVFTEYEIVKKIKMYDDVTQINSSLNDKRRRIIKIPLEHDVKNDDTNKHL